MGPLMDVAGPRDGRFCAFDQQVELLLDAADEGIGDKLREFAAEQAAGERLSAVAEAYFKRHPRSFDAPWPSELASDRALRHFLSTTSEDEHPVAIKAKAKEQLDIDLDQLSYDRIASYDNAR